MPYAGMHAANFILCWLHESLHCMLCSLLAGLPSIYTCTNHCLIDGEGSMLPLLDIPTTKNPNPCSSLVAEAGAGLGRAGGWGGVNTHSRCEK